MCPSKEFFLDGVPGALGVAPLCLPGVRGLEAGQAYQESVNPSDTMELD